MSELGISAALGTPLKGADFGVREPPAPDSPAFAAIVASLGFETVQGSARQQLQPAASISRPGAEAGNIVPMRALNSASVQGLPLAPMNPVPNPADPTQVAARPRTHDPAGAAPAFTTAPAATPIEFHAGFPAGMKSFPKPQGTSEIALSAMTERAADAAESVTAAAAARAAPVALEAALSAATVPATAPGPTVVTAETPVPLHHPRFGEAFAQQVTVMARDGVQQARITVNPPELGPVELRVIVRNDEATVQFAAQHAAVREILEDALPRLREQFEQAGLRLHDGSVSDQLPQRSDEREPGNGSESLTADGPDSDDRFGHDERLVHHGLIDTFA